MTLQLHCQVSRGDFNLDVELTFPDREVTALFGASGSGKTSILRIIAGLDHEPGVSVFFNGETWQDSQIFVPAHQRRVGYVFQHLNLFPNMTADRNLTYAEQRSHSSTGLSRQEIIDVLEISNLLHKYPEQLSGGEQQRVAIARSLLSHPALLLMDEPLGSIDQSAKARILPYLQRIHQMLDIPAIFVSHSLDEVLYLADRVVEISDGRVLQEVDVINFATSEGATTGGDAAAIVSCRVRDHDDKYHLTHLELEGQPLIVSAPEFDIDDQVRVKIPARDVSITRERAVSSSILNVIECLVESITSTSNEPGALVRLRTGNQVLMARVTRKSIDDLSLKEGDHVFAQIKGVALMIDHER